MGSRGFQSVAGRLQSLLVLGSASDLTDGQLLDRFAKGEGLAFEALIDRHGSMVLRVCRSVLRDPHDAQDAFQATFLVLVEKARSIRDGDSLASWLHGVALRVARHARGVDARRRRLDRTIALEAPSLATVEVEPDDFGLKLHDEVGRLPERYRAAVVLCYLEGLSCEQAATALNWPVGTVKSRLSRARERLKGRLTRLGLAPELPALVRSDLAISPRLARETAGAATRFGAKKPDQTPLSAPVLLAKGVLKTMTLAKLKIPALALLAATSLVGASAALSPGQPIPVPVQEPAKVVKPAEPQAKTVEAEPPFLLAPRNLTATFGSGRALMYKLDDKGERIGEPGAKQKGIPDANLAGPFQEVEKDLRWVVVVGLLDHKLIRERWAKARGDNVADFQPNYKRVELERQIRQPDGSWSEWDPQNLPRNWEILDNLPEIAPEKIPEVARPMVLVDPLPFLKKGIWEGVNPRDERFNWQILSELRPAPKKADEKPDFYPTVMTRTFDFFPEAGTTCRYRARVVFFNPDYGQIRPIPRLPNDRRIPALPPAPRNLFTPWSEPTAEVRVP